VSSKREREYERRRHEKWVARQRAREARARRNRVIAGSVIAAVVLAAVVWVAVTVVRSLTATPASAATPSTAASSAPDPSVAEDRTWTVNLTTSAGDLTLELDGHAAPQAVAAVVTLAKDGFYDGTSCHRLTVTDPMYVLQCGDPTGLGSGGPGWSFGPIENAPADQVYPAGTVAMARSQNDANSMGSQFFLVYRDSTIPDDAAGGYTVIGKVTTGLDVLQKVAQAGVQEGTTAPVTQVTIEKVETQ
jgi:peptidyl-prolyl cis-trans isomerase B (cyclophilin B)